MVRRRTINRAKRVKELKVLLTYFDISGTMEMALSRSTEVATTEYLELFGGNLQYSFEYAGRWECALIPTDQLVFLPEK